MRSEAEGECGSSTPGRRASTATELRAPYTRFALASSIGWSLRTIVFANLFCLLMSIVASTGSEDAHLWIKTLVAFNGAAAVFWLLMVPRKMRARQACNIIFLRGFRQEARADVPNRVLPCIGCYGRILWLPNAVRSADHDYIGFLSGKVMIDAGRQLGTQSDWRLDLLELLEKADLAVIDFSVPSDNLHWEIEKCLQRFPAERIILIAELSRYTTQNYQLLCARFKQLWSVPSPIPIYPSRYVIPLRIWRWWFFSFERRMHKCMRIIAG